MKMSVLLVASGVLTAASGHAQGFFNFSNVYARTHIGSIDGPLAGPGTWAQMLAGGSADAVGPVGKPSEHLDIGGSPSGLVFGGTVQVPGIPGGETAYIEMLVWDGSLWGTAFAGVPKDQFGMTDTVQVALTDPSLPGSPQDPHFTRSAIVPVPEPSGLCIATMGGLGAMFISALRKWTQRGSGGTTHRQEG